jgi:hypothetical protein
LKAKGGKVAQQNLDFNIAANVKGMEAIATLINRVGALEAETKKLASANSALSTSTDAVIRNGTRYNSGCSIQGTAQRPSGYAAAWHADQRLCDFGFDRRERIAGI